MKDNLTEVILKALHERLQRINGRGRPQGLTEQLDEIAKRCGVLPVLDPRNENEILGYDQNGIPR